MEIKQTRRNCIPREWYETQSCGVKWTPETVEWVCEWVIEGQVCNWVSKSPDNKTTAGYDGVVGCTCHECKLWLPKQLSAFTLESKAEHTNTGLRRHCTSAIPLVRRTDRQTQTKNTRNYEISRFLCRVISLRVVQNRFSLTLACHKTTEVFQTVVKEENVNFSLSSNTQKVLAKIFKEYK